MTTTDGGPLVSLSEQVSGLLAAHPPSSVLPIGIPISIPPIPIHFNPVITTIMWGGSAIGYVVTPFGDPAPTSASVALKSGILWVEAALFGAAFSSTPGFAGIPFSAATMTTNSSVTFGGGNIVLAAAATLSFKVTSATSPVTGPP